MKRLFCLPLLLLLTTISAHAQVKPPITVEGAWMRAVPRVANGSVIYFTLVNNTTEPLKLTSASTEIAQKVEPMITTKKIVSGQEVYGMEDVPAFDIPAKGKLVLEPDGNHLMVIGLQSHPKAGDKVKLTLTFSPGGKVLEFEIPVLMEAPKP